MVKDNTNPKTWWIYLVLGILVLICGGNFLANPLATLTTISFLNGLFFIVAGGATIIALIIERKQAKKWLLHLILNIIVVIVGALMLSKLRLTITYLWLIAGLGFVGLAASVIIKSIDCKKSGDSGWVYMLIFGILIGIFSLMVIGNPILGLNFISSIVAAAVICFGIYLIIISFNLKPPKKK